MGKDECFADDETLQLCSECSVEENTASTDKYGFSGDRNSDKKGNTDF